MVHGTHNAIHDDRNESIIIYINGAFHVRNEAKISELIEHQKMKYKLH